MTDLSPSPLSPQGPPAISSPAAPAEIDSSCRVPLLLLFLSAAVWLVISSTFALITSIKFHSPNFLADFPWLTYGRVHPVCLNAALYGFCLQAGLGVALWLLARLGRTTLAQRWLVTLGALVWNLGVTLGILGILAGNSAGFENLEMPLHAALLVFLGYALIAISGVLTFHQRREREVFVSQWFLLTALFWFAWIYSTANLLLLAFPVRGVAQAVLAWWFSDNLLFVWLGLVGLAAVFYLVPKLTGRVLHSHYLALFTYWTLILFASWGGIPETAPVPAWMPTLSTIAAGFTLLPILAVALNVFGTALIRTAIPAPAPQSPLGSPSADEPRSAKGLQKILPLPFGRGEGRGEGYPSSLTTALRDRHSGESTALSFILFGVAAFIFAGLMLIARVLPEPDLYFTWFATARTQLQFYGFFAMVMFGAIYYIMPRLTGMDFPWPRLVRAHFWLATAGIVLLALPLAAAGVIQGFQLQDAKIAFVDLARSTLPFLRVSTVGDLLLWVGHLLLVGNLFGLAVRCYRAKTVVAYAEITVDLFQPAEVRS
jgi:cytochrome c oxidase cbb3-type subunit I